MSPRLQLDSSTREDLRRPVFFVASALVVVAAVINGFVQDLTPMGYIASFSAVIVTIGTLAFMLILTTLTGTVRFILAPGMLVALITAILAGSFGSLVKADPLAALRAEEEAARTLYTSKVTVTNECVIFEAKAPEGVKVRARSQTDTIIPRTTHCDVTIDWSKYSVRAIPTWNGASNLGDLDSSSNKGATELRFTMPYGTRLDVYLFQPDLPTYKIDEDMLDMPPSTALANRS